MIEGEALDRDDADEGKLHGSVEVDAHGWRVVHGAVDVDGDEIAGFEMNVGVIEPEQVRRGGWGAGGRGRRWAR